MRVLALVLAGLILAATAFIPSSTDDSNDDSFEWGAPRQTAVTIP